MALPFKTGGAVAALLLYEVWLYRLVTYLKVKWGHVVVLDVEVALKVLLELFLPTLTTDAVVCNGGFDRFWLFKFYHIYN